MLDEELLKRYATKEEKIKMIKTAILKIKFETVSPNLSKVRYILAMVKESSLNEELSNDPEIIKCMIEHNFVIYVATILKYVQRTFPSFLVDDKLWSLIDSAYSIMCNFCEKDSQLCKQIADSGIHDLIIEIVTSEEYYQRVRYLLSTEFRKLFSFKMIDRLDDHYTASARICLLINSACCIIHNLKLYNEDSDTNFFYSDSVKQFLYKYTKLNQNESLGIASYSALVNVTDGKEDPDLFLVGEKFINNFFTWIRYEINRTSEQPQSCYRIWELLYILNRVSQSESVLYKIVSPENILIISEVLKKSNTEIELKYALLLLNSISKHSIMFNLSIQSIDIENDLEIPLSLHRKINYKVVDDITMLLKPKHRRLMIF